MVGNDIVDLADRDADVSSYDARFDGRVFSVSERARIASSSDPDRQRWRLWAAKEASYKLARKHDPRVVFSPIAFRVELEFIAMGRHEGRVIWAEDSIGVEGSNVAEGSTGVEGASRVEVRESERWIHAIAIPESASFDAVTVSIDSLGSGSLDEDPSRAVRGLVRREMSDRLGVASDDLRVERRGRIPELWRRGSRLPLSLSLSHHGDFVAFACCSEEGST